MTTSNTAPDTNADTSAETSAAIAAVAPAATPDTATLQPVNGSATAPAATTAATTATTATATSAPSESPAQQARALLKRLQTLFPAFRDCLPLAIGIDKQLHAALPELNRKILRIALGIHTNSLRYLRVMEKATHRFDLTGQQTDQVSEAHRVHAAEILRERFKKDAEQRKAQKTAVETQKAAVEVQKAAAEAARVHSEKLSQLSEKFSRKK